jgi:hypothetical protein
MVYILQNSGTGDRRIYMEAEGQAKAYAVSGRTQAESPFRPEENMEMPVSPEVYMDGEQCRQNTAGFHPSQLVE